MHALARVALLELPAQRLRAYTPEVVATKANERVRYERALGCALNRDLNIEIRERHRRPLI